MKIFYDVCIFKNTTSDSGTWLEMTAILSHEFLGRVRLRIEKGATVVFPTLSMRRFPYSHSLIIISRYV